MTSAFLLDFMAHKAIDAASTINRVSRRAPAGSALGPSRTWLSSRSSQSTLNAALPLEDTPDVGLAMQGTVQLIRFEQ